VPFVTGVDVKTNVDRFDINIQIWGNIWADFASILEVFFVGTVADLIEQAIIYGCGTTIPAVFNALVASSNGYIPMPVYADWSLNWETQNRVEVTDTYM